MSDGTATRHCHQAVRSCSARKVHNTRQSYSGSPSNSIWKERQQANRLLRQHFSRVLAEGSTTSPSCPDTLDRSSVKDQQQAFRTIGNRVTPVRRCNNNTYALWFIGWFWFGRTAMSHPYSRPSGYTTRKAQQQANCIPNWSVVPVCWKNNKPSAFCYGPSIHSEDTATRSPDSRPAHRFWFSGRTTFHPHSATDHRCTQKVQQQANCIPDLAITDTCWNSNKTNLLCSLLSLRPVATIARHPKSGGVVKLRASRKSNNPSAFCYELSFVLGLNGRSDNYTSLHSSVGMLRLEGTATRLTLSSSSEFPF